MGVRLVRGVFQPGYGGPRGRPLSAFIRVVNSLIVMGLDPGTKGAVAILDTGSAPRISVWAFPTVSLTIGGKNRTRIDLDACWSLMFGLAATFEPSMCFIEDVNGFSGNAKSTGSASFTFGSTVGAVEAFLVASTVPRQKVPPSVWTKALKVSGKTKKERKDASRVAASQLFPEHADLFRRVKDDGVAEAALIAWYGATKVMGYKP